MKTLKELETELILDWHSLQLLESEQDKTNALKAYYVKYAIYRRTRRWLIVLEPVMH